MTDKKFDRLLCRLRDANEKYMQLLEQAEAEFKQRYKVFPSDIDFDSWIDVYHVGSGGNMTVLEIENELQYYSKTIKNYLDSDESI